MSRLHQIQTAFLLDQYAVEGDFATDPYEAGWASEAIAFIYVRAAPEVEVGTGVRATLEARVEVSADGQRWIDHDLAFPPISTVGGYRLPVSHFGNWLRLTCTAKNLAAARRFVVDLYWVFKE